MYLYKNTWQITIWNVNFRTKILLIEQLNKYRIGITALQKNRWIEKKIYKKNIITFIKAVIRIFMSWKTDYILAKNSYHWLLTNQRTHLYNPVKEYSIISLWSIYMHLKKNVLIKLKINGTSSSQRLKCNNIRS